MGRVVEPHYVKFVEGSQYFVWEEQMSAAVASNYAVNLWWGNQAWTHALELKGA